MVLKRIEVYGFKSFADKLNVDFDEGMTGIVGPNGCGKSNVADAIRWVLGEQSAKSLRGSNMQDVIFSGTSIRKSMSYCEVSLVFDNTVKIFPLEFDEVAITRKLYRSGDSEYLINRSTCRLKDILDIMRDTGIGKEGYSIIGQGQVEEIFKSKPEDRRAIFEEAVGISKFKARKTESERKLSRTRDNIEKLNLIIGEIENRLGPLEKQSIAARKFAELHSSLKYNEVNAYLYQFENNEEFKRQIQERLDGVREEYAMVEAEFANADLNYMKKTEEQSRVDSDINELHREQVEIVKSETSLKGEGDVLATRLEYYRNEQERIREETGIAETDLAKNSELLTGYVAEINEIRQKMERSQKNYAQIEAEYLRVVDEILKKEREIDENNRTMIASISELSDVKVNIKELATRLESLKERIEETDQAMSEQKSGIEREESARRALEQEYEALSKERDLRKRENDALILKNNETTAQIASGNLELRELSNGIGAVEAKLRLLKEYKENYEAFNGSVRQLLQRAKNNDEIRRRIDGVVAAVIRTPKELETAIETALGGALQNIITKQEEDAKFIIEFLRREKLGRITFLPLSSARARAFDASFEALSKSAGCIGIASKLIDYDKKYADLMSSLLGKTLIFKDIDTAIAASKKSNYAYKIVTLEGDVFVHGAITGGSKRSDSADLLKQDREIEMAAALYKKYEQRYTQKVEELKSLETESEHCVKALAENGQLLKEKELALVSAEERLSESVSRIDEMTASLARLGEAMATMQAQADEYSMRISSVDRMEADIKSKTTSTDSMMKKSKELFGGQKQQRDQIHEKLTNEKVNLAAFEKELYSAESNLKRLQDDCENLKLLIDSGEQQLVENQEKIRQTEEKLNKLAEIETYGQRNREIVNKIEELTAYKRKLQEEVLDINNQKDRLAKRLSEVNEHRVKEENALEKIDTQMTAMAERIWEEYELTYENAASLKDENFDITGAQTEINKLRKEISRLGPVNPTAIEEFNEQSKRFTEYRTQADDLEKAESDLVTIIEDLSKEMIEIFDREFKKINANFKVIFKELFGGGHAELVLDYTNSDDPLEAGVEIMAQPPSKKLNRISLLSGGERTLTAIAILFSILRLRPIPFCVLDEVEAALDDSNAGLVAQYIKKFSKETQFIVITHRKPTMELADRLYGVTMQEKGVSKMVSVKLSEAVKQAEQEQAGS